MAATHCWVHVADGLAVSADVDFVVVVLCGLAINGVVEIHALGVLAPPIAPNQVPASAEQSDDHCGKDRDCMCLTHTQQQHTAGALTQPRGHRAEL